jgi:hypothetical protein
MAYARLNMEAGKEEAKSEGIITPEYSMRCRECNHEVTSEDEAVTNRLI